MKSASLISEFNNLAKILLTPTEVHDIGVVWPHHNHDNDRNRDPVQEPRAAAETRWQKHHDDRRDQRVSLYLWSICDWINESIIMRHSNKRNRASTGHSKQVFFL